MFDVPTGVAPAHPPLPPDQLAAAARTAEQLGAIMQALWHMRTPAGAPDLRGRLSAARHIAGQTRLMDPSAISLQDVSDEGIRRHMGVVISIERQLGQTPFGPDPGGAELATRRSGLAAGRSTMGIASNDAMPPIHKTGGI